MGARDVARSMFWDRLFHPPTSESRASQFRQAIPSHPARVVAPHVVVTWVGHSSFLVQLDGVNLLTDPIWSDRAGPLALLGPKRCSLPAFRSMPCHLSTRSSCPTIITTISTIVRCAASSDGIRRPPGLPR